MITRLTHPVTKNCELSDAVKNRISSELLELRTPQSSTQKKSAGLHSCTTMGTLGHLVCGCCGLASVALFAGVINLIVNMLFEQSLAVDLPQLMRSFGG